jgi:putative intracellular protease/amidase
MKVAILVENGFEQSDMTEPRKALEQAGLKRASSLLFKDAFEYGK